MQKKYQFFISSQRELLKHERSFAFQTILDLGHIPVGVDIIYPHKVYAMQNYAAKYIDASQFVIFILAHGYGAISNYSNRSFIEEEYEYALSQNKQIICFIESEYMHGDDDRQISFIKRILNHHSPLQTVCFWNQYPKFKDSEEHHLSFKSQFYATISNLLVQSSPATYWVRTSSLLDKEAKDDPMARLRLYISNTADEKNVDILALMYKDLEELNEFYRLTKIQAKRSFALAVTMCMLGFLLFAVSAYSAYTGHGIDISTLISVGGVIVEFLAGTALYVYNKALTQLNRYYDALHNNERYMSLIHISTKTKMKDELLGKIVDSELTRTHLEVQNQAPSQP